MLYAVKNASDLNADLIIKRGNSIYCCFLNPSLVNHQSATPVEEQNAWKIEKIETYTDNGDEITKTTYPSGQNGLYNFCPANINDYTFEYQN